MITLTQKGEFNKTLGFFEYLLQLAHLSKLDRYGQMGVEALASATPVDTGLTASSWVYEIVRGDSGASIVWKNTNVNDGVNIAIILQYGHGTGTGGYVQGRDYINPAIRPVFEKIAQEIREEMRP